MNTQQKSRYINIEKFRGVVEGILREAVDSWDASVGEYVRFMKDCAEDYLEEYVDGVMEDTIISFDNYVHRADTSIFGNFADICRDYEREHKGKSFRKLIEQIDADIVNADVEEFKEWTMGWYFNAFGTYNLKYNWTQFMEDMSDD